MIKEKEKPVPKTFAVVDFSQEAKEFCAFDSINVQIYIYSGGQLVEKDWYSEKKVKDLISRGIPIVYKFDTSSCQMPEDRIMFSRVKVMDTW